MGRLVLAGSIAGGLAMSFAACSQDARPPPPAGSNPLGSGGAGSSGGAGPIDAGFSDAPPDPDASGLCGNQFVPILIDRPNIYFLVDRSGSMQTPIDGVSRYSAAVQAIDGVVGLIGDRVKLGATVFPGGNGGQCASGQEVFETRVGDSGGDAHNQLLAALSSVSVEGGTPTAATLSALLATLTALEGDSYVVLTTDGGPNCNGQASCEYDQCMLNIEGFSNGQIDCTGTFNCCSSAVGLEAPRNCLDRQATVDAVAALAAAGVPTYVIGMPGSEAYADTLNEMAIAAGTGRASQNPPGAGGAAGAGGGGGAAGTGGTAGSGGAGGAADPTEYYAINDTNELEQAMTEIAVEVAISCQFELSEVPPDDRLVNVYFDQDLIPGDEENGWAWTGEQSLVVRGEACARLKSGAVSQVQIVAGCPTVVL